MQVLLGCLTRSVSPVTACMTGGKKGRGEKSGKREKRRRSSFSLHSGGKRVFLSSHSPFFTSSLSLFDACHTGYGVWPWNKIAFGEGNVVKLVRIAHRKLFAGKSEMGSQLIFTYIFNYTKRWQIN